MIVDGLYDPLIKAYLDGVQYVEYLYGIESSWLNNLKDKDIIKAGPKKHYHHSVEYYMKKFLENYGSPYFKDLDETTKKWTINKVLEVHKKGGNADDLWNELKGNKAFTKSRADVIFHTEMNRAFNAGTIDRMKSLGIVRAYVKCQMDKRSCAECMALNGVVKSLKELDGLLPLHPFCRCVIRALPDDKLQAKNPHEEISEEPIFGEYNGIYEWELKEARNALKEGVSIDDLKEMYLKSCPVINHYVIDGWKMSTSTKDAARLIEIERSFHKAGKFRSARAGGKITVTDLEREEYVKAVAINRAVFEQSFPKGTKLYRGTDREHIGEYMSSPLESYTPRLTSARYFGDNVIDIDIKPEEVRFYQDFAGLYHGEHEVVISKEGPYKIRVKKVEI
jgi:SPP1 gp7 family putative phage head morphogenesis protein